MKAVARKGYRFLFFKKNIKILKKVLTSTKKYNIILDREINKNRQPKGRKRAIKMKEFEYCHEEITMGVEIFVTVCETQKEMVKIISEYRKECKWGTADEYTVIWVIYKDGSTFYHAFNDGEAEGKFKRTGIERAVISTSWEVIVFGDFSIIDNGSISIDESDIEEYGVYAGQYDAKEQGEKEVQETETNETTDETETEETIKTTAEQEATETVEGISKMEIPTETGNSGFEYYSVKVAYEVIKDEIRSALFTSYSLALKVAKDFTDMWDGDKAIVIAVNFVIRNDRQPESERDKRVLETETAEIERRCVPYHDWGLSGYVSIEDRQVIV